MIIFLTLPHIYLPLVTSPHPARHNLTLDNSSLPNLDTSEFLKYFKNSNQINYFSYCFFTRATASLISSSLTVVLPACFASSIAS